MKKQELLQLALMVCSFSEFFLNAQQKRNIKAIDPIIDFRAPQSLMESLQEGINVVYHSLQSGNIAKAELQNAESQLSDLMSLCDSTMNTTRQHHVNEDDKAFLQKMIDRIDQLIDQLEKTDDKEEQDRSMIRSIRSLCHNLKDKIS